MHPYHIVRLVPVEYLQLWQGLFAGITLLDRKALLLRAKVGGQGINLRTWCYASVSHSPPQPNPTQSFRHWITIKNHSIQYSIQKQNQIIHSKNYSFKLDKTTQLEKTVENRQKRPVLTSKGAFYSFFFWITHFFYSFNNSFNHTAKIFIQRIYSFKRDPKLSIQRIHSSKKYKNY